MATWMARKGRGCSLALGCRQGWHQQQWGRRRLGWWEAFPPPPAPANSSKPAAPRGPSRWPLLNWCAAWAPPPDSPAPTPRRGKQSSPKLPPPHALLSLPPLSLCAEPCRARPSPPPPFAALSQAIAARSSGSLRTLQDEFQPLQPFRALFLRTRAASLPTPTTLGASRCRCRYRPRNLHRRRCRRHPRRRCRRSLFPAFSSKHHHYYHHHHHHSRLSPSSAVPPPVTASCSPLVVAAVARRTQPLSAQPA
mmetsp:Transcript_39065/g.76998  ORF Transcript_39065/g.76998 Transcript_39065/m.76998 type:complete len:251 (-) Transcript_39065:289-1041(-)